MPLARSYLSEAKRTGDPILASTFSRQGDHTTAYLLAFADDPHSGNADFSLIPSELGFRQPVAVFDPQSNTIAVIGPSGRISGKLAGPNAFAYRIVAPISRSGIAVLGDLGKFVPMGRKRISAYRDIGGGELVGIAAAANEEHLTITGYSASPLTASAEHASVESVTRNDATGLFEVKLQRASRAAGQITLLLRRQR